MKRPALRREGERWRAHKKVSLLGTDRKNDPRSSGGSAERTVLGREKKKKKLRKRREKAFP